MKLHFLWMIASPAIDLMIGVGLLLRAKIT